MLFSRYIDYLFTDARIEWIILSIIITVTLCEYIGKLYVDLLEREAEENERMEFFMSSQQNLSKYYCTAYFMPQQQNLFERNRANENVIPVVGNERSDNTEIEFFNNVYEQQDSLEYNRTNEYVTEDVDYESKSGTEIEFLSNYYSEEDMTSDDEGSFEFL